MLPRKSDSDTFPVLGDSEAWVSSMLENHNTTKITIKWFRDVVGIKIDIIYEK